MGARLAIAALALLAAGCSEPDDCYVKPAGAPDVELLEARWTSANCTKSFSIFEGEWLEVPGAHAFSSDRERQNIYPGCLNGFDAETVIDETGMSIDYQIAVQSDLIPDRPPPINGPDPLLIMPRITNVVQWMVFRAHVPLEVTMESGATLEGDGAWAFGNFIAMQLWETPIRLGGRGARAADAPVSFYEQLYRDPTPTSDARFTGHTSIPPATYQLEPGREYVAMVVAEADGYRAGAYNIQSDITIEGTASITIEPGEARSCGR